MENKTLNLIIENYKAQLFELMKFDFLTIEQESEKVNLIKALEDLINARVIYKTFYETH
jgi:hypothetical protein